MLEQRRGDVLGVVGGSGAGKSVLLNTIIGLKAPEGGSVRIFGADIRQTRLNFSVRGPQILGGAVPKAVAEFDLFGGDGPGGYGDVSVFPRIRIAYTELNWGGKHILQFGQQNMLTIGLIPQTLSHIAFPWSYTAGTVGWRQPGFWGYHTFGGDTRFEFAWSIQRAGWANTLLTSGQDRKSVV